MIAIAKNDVPVFNNDGLSFREVLQGTHPLVRVYRCTLQAGHTTVPELVKNRMLFYCFIQGKGYIACRDRAYNVEEPCFFIPDFANQNYLIRAAAATDLEYVVFDVDMLQSDRIFFEDTHYLTPWFKTLSACEAYDQTCKGPNTLSYMVLNGRIMGRILCGVCFSEGGGTKEKGHPAVDQWNVTLPGADFTLYVENEEVHHGPLEVSYVKAGLDHGLVAEPGKKVAYIWFEHFVEEFKTAVQNYDENGRKYGHNE